MAWTRSTPRRGKCVNFQLAPQARLSVPWTMESATPADKIRIFLLAVAAVAALIAAILPHVTIETMAISAILFATLCCAAAALTSDAFIFSLLPRTQAAEPAQGPAASRYGEASEIHARGFDEILATRRQQRHGHGHALDRQHWAKLTAHMSHELRTPLNAVLGFSELIAKEALGPVHTHCYKDYAYAINESGRSLLKSVEDTLAITALLTNAKPLNCDTACCISSELTEALAFHSEHFDARLISVDSCNVTNAQVCGEQTAIRQLLINALSHAAKLADRNSSITIEQRQTTTTCILEISTPVNNPAATTAQGETAFNLMLAKTLAELSTVRLLEDDTQTGKWSIQICLQCPMQSDFFSDCEPRAKAEQYETAI